jgi:hypothetical protein
VVEMEFLPKPKLVSYEREIQCDLFEEGIALPKSSANGDGDFDTTPHVDNLASVTMDRSIKHSAGLVSSTTHQAAPSEADADFDRNVDEIDTNGDHHAKSKHATDFKVLSKDDAKAVMTTKEFEQFMNKTSKMVERALDGAYDVIGPSSFFE